jgi:mannose-6-phosphate isomerase-like protein (cupin superfamily)
MIRSLSAMPFSPKENIRGGRGPALGADYLAKGEMDNVLSAGRTVLAPGSSVGEHTHPATEELYLILEGTGQGILDGRRFPVGPGDLFLCKAGHSHGLENDGPVPLAFFGLMTPRAAPEAGAAGRTGA